MKHVGEASRGGSVAVNLTEAGERVFQACRDAGGRPLLVGGAVRDALLTRALGGVRPKDVDIEVFGEVDEQTLVDRLRSVAHVDIVGASYRVLVVSINGESYDVSIAGAGETFAMAAGRRDFTVNALAWDPESRELVDPHGGAADLEEGVLRLVSPEGFSDDPLRVLRAVQFVARFGFSLEAGTIAAARAAIPRFADIAPERIWQEWRKIAGRGRYISLALTALEEIGWLAHFPALADTRGVPQDPRWHPEGDVFTHLGLSADAAAAEAESVDRDPASRETVVLAALVHDVGKAVATTVHPDGSITSHGHETSGVPIARRFLEGIGAPAAVRRRVGILVREHMVHVSVAGAPSAAAVRRLVRRLDADGTGVTIDEWAAVVSSDGAGRGRESLESPAEVWLAVAEREGGRPRPALLRGSDLIAFGLTPGLAFREILAASIRAQDDGVVSDRQEALAWLERHLRGRDGEERRV